MRRSIFSTFLCFSLMLMFFIGCKPIVITDPDIFPEKEVFGRIILLPNPTNPNSLVLGLGSREENPDSSTFILLRDCFSNELISCVDTIGQMKEYIVLCVGEETTWENIKLDKPVYVKDGDEYYVKIYFSTTKEIDYRAQELGDVDTLEINFNDDWRKYLLSTTLENNKQTIQGTQYPSYRILRLNPLHSNY